ncbi:branched-chain amino acid ABC transporter permease [Mesorhizobium sp. M1169]|uniref:branched-chain amino acid ABC transporter permease n=1 Tax=Mesorhizobium sp. M1169 TaxID=2957066 RepID=UPI00333B6927
MIRLFLGAIVLVLLIATPVWLAVAVWPDWLNAILISKKAFLSAILNGVTLAGLYFLVASGFTLIFGLMRNVNLAHGSLFLLGSYVGYEVVDRTGSWLAGLAAGFAALAAIGVGLQIAVFRNLEGDDMRQTLVSIGVSVIAADLMLSIWGGATYQIPIPDLLAANVRLPFVTAIRSDGSNVYLAYPVLRLTALAIAVVAGIALWSMLKFSRVGMMVRAGVDDKAMLDASGVNVHRLFAVVFAFGAGLAGLAGVVGGSVLSVSPGEDVRYLLVSLVVVIVGGMGSIPGAAIGALLIGLAEQISLVYMPTYGIVLIFLIMMATLAVRPRGLMGLAR